jgi:hypothetical protein
MQELNRVRTLFIGRNHSIYGAGKIHDAADPELPCNIKQIQEKEKESQERRRIKPDSPMEERRESSFR